MMDHFDVLVIAVVTVLAGAAFTFLTATGHDASLFRDVVMGGIGALGGLGRSAQRSAPVPVYGVPAPAAPPA